MTLACEYANSKPLEVVTVADVDAENKQCRPQFGADFDAGIWS